MGLIGAVLAVLPFIPGVRSVPRLIPVHRLIWRRRRGGSSKLCTS